MFGQIDITIPKNIIHDVNQHSAYTPSNQFSSFCNRLALESYLILSSSEPLCLDPSPTVGLIKNLAQQRAKPFKTHTLKR